MKIGHPPKSSSSLAPRPALARPGFDVRCAAVEVQLKLVAGAGAHILKGPPSLLMVAWPAVDAPFKIV